jgi:hypothetical protein
MRSTAISMFGTTDVSAAHNKQLQWTVMQRRGRGAGASVHCAHAVRWTRGRAAAELRR